MSASFIPEIEKIPGVEAVEPRVWGYFYLASLQANFTIYGMDLNLLKEGEYQKIVNWKNVPGQATNPNLSFRPDFRMIVGQGVFELLRDIRMENAFLFYQPTWQKPIPFDIIGTFKTETELQSNDMMILQTEGARQVLELPPDEFSDLAVYVPNPEEIDNIALKIRRLFPELRTITRAQIQNTYSSV
ncbi:MAG: ABC transporter permease, partial [Deltaproteobacteria bacterium]|nr:ABC transporter permease [Deltaproteobacteria bacterium]